MIKKLGIFVLLLGSVSAFAQTESSPVTATSAPTTKTKRYSRPDIPGVFLVELGVNNSFQGTPSDFSLGFWGSRTVNLYWQYELRLFKSKFSLVPGLGVSLERFKFKNFHILDYGAGDSLKVWNPTVLGFPGVKKSQLITNYIDLPVELRFSSRPDDPTRSFKMAVGFRVGYMYDAFTKVKYREDGETKKLKDNQNFQLNRFRYGAYFKVGLGNVSLFTYYNMTPLFKSGEGPWQRSTNAGVTTQSLSDFSTFTAGLSFASF